MKRNDKMKNAKKIIRRLLLLIMLICLTGTGSGTWAAVQSTYHSAAAGLTGNRNGARTELAGKKKKNKNKNKNNGSSQNNSSRNEDSQKDGSGSSNADGKPDVTEDGTYTSKEDVAEYIHLFGHLPDNFITKNEAKDLGWVSSWGNLDDVAPGKSIGGDYFGNYEGQLPAKKGRKYYECDIDFTGGYRSEKRIIFSNDGLIFYTEDHYETFEQLY